MYIYLTVFHLSYPFRSLGYSSFLPDYVRRMNDSINDVVPDQGSVLLVDGKGYRDSRSLGLTVLPALTNLNKNILK